MSVGVLKDVAHIAVAVNSLTEVDKWEKLLCVEKTEEYESAEQGIRVRVVHTPSIKIEFMEPMRDDSPISSFLKKNPFGGIHHLCFSCEDVKKTSTEFEAQKVRSLSRNASMGVEGRPIAFFHPHDLSGVLLEIEEK